MKHRFSILGFTRFVLTSLPIFFKLNFVYCSYPVNDKTHIRDSVLIDNVFNSQQAHNLSWGTLAKGSNEEITKIVLSSSRHDNISVMNDGHDKSEKVNINKGDNDNAVVLSITTPIAINISEVLNQCPTNNLVFNMSSSSETKENFASDCNNFNCIAKSNKELNINNSDNMSLVPKCESDEVKFERIILGVESKTVELDNDKQEKTADTASMDGVVVVKPIITSIDTESNNHNKSDFSTTEPIEAITSLNKEQVSEQPTDWHQEPDSIGKYILFKFLHCFSCGFLSILLPFFLSNHLTICYTSALQSMVICEYRCAADNFHSARLMY